MNKRYLLLLGISMLLGGLTQPTPLIEARTGGGVCDGQAVNSACSYTGFTDGGRTRQTLTGTCQGSGNNLQCVATTTTSEPTNTNTNRRPGQSTSGPGAGSEPNNTEGPGAGSDPNNTEGPGAGSEENSQGETSSPQQVSFQNPSRFTSIPELLAGVVNAALGVLGGLAVVMIVFSGIKYMTSSNPGDVAKATEGIKNAIIGLVIVMGAYLIVQFVISALV